MEKKDLLLALLLALWWLTTTTGIFLNHLHNEQLSVSLAEAQATQEHVLKRLDAYSRRIERIETRLDK